MAVNILLKKSSTPDNRPDPAAMLNGEVDINYDAVTGGLFYKNTNGEVVKVGPCQFSPTPPNATPAGSPGNSVGELWFNTSVNGLFIWDGTSWIDVTTGIAVQTISGLSPIVIDNTDPTAPVVTLPSTAPGDLLVGDSSGSFSILAAGAAEYILQSNGDGTLSWVVNSAGDVTSVTAVAPIVVDNTDPQNPVVSADAATTSAPGVVQLNDTVTSTSTTEAATANAVKTAYDLADAAIPDATFTAAGELIVGTGAGTYSALPAGAADYILSSDGLGSLVWVPNSANDVTSVTGSSPITVNNTDPQNPIVGIDAASTGQAGAVQLNDTVTSTSTTQAATANAVKTAYDAALNSVQTVTGTAPVQVDNTDPQNLIVSVDAATTTTPGIVQLNDTTSSSSTSEALTANQGYVLQQQIDALVVTNNLTFAGTYNASTGLVDNVSAAGALVGFVAGSPLPAAAPGNADYFVIVDTEGSTGPAGTPPYHVGDWFLSDGTAYQFLNVGFQPSYATTSSSGVVQLATDLEVQAGLNTDHAVVPSSLQSKLSDSTSTTSSTTIASSTAVKSAYDLADAALPKAGGTMTGNLYISNSELQVDSTGIFTSIGTATFTGTTDLNGATSFFFTPTWLENIGPASQVTFDNILSGLTATNVQDAIDEIVTNSPWTESAGVISPANSGSVVNIPVAAGVDGLKVEDTALNFSTVVRPDLIQMTDNVQSLSFNPATSVITHVVDSLLSNTAGVVAQDESANLTPYNIAASYLSLNGVATGINIRTLPWPQIESWDSMNINIANFSGALGMQAGGVDLVLVGGDNGGGVSYLQAQPNVMIEGLGPLNIKPATDAADAVQFQTSAGSKVLTVDTLTPAVKIGDGVSAYTLPIADGAANYILSTDGAGTVSWIANAADGVQSVSGTSPVSVDNTDPANPIISVDAASTSAAGIVQLNNTTSSTSTSEAATANAVKIAYDTAVAAASGGTVNGITSDTVIFVNCTDGNNSTGQRGTNKPFLTITAALAAASEGDTIFLSPGTFIENVTLSKGVNLVGTMNDQALAAGTKIQGNFTVSISGAPTKNWAISHVYFISTNSTPPFTVSNNSFGAGGIATVNNCTFTQQTSADPTQYAVATSGTWSRSLYFRECTFDGSFHHNAGTAAGASGYVVLDRVLGVGNSDFYYRVTTGTLEIRNPSNSLASVFQTGGVALIQNAASGITANGAATTTVFGGTGFSYKGSAASVGTGTVYFTGETQGTGKVEFGANLIYGYTSLIMDPANLTVNVAAIAYTTAVPAAANAQTISQQRPRLDLLKTSSSVTAANQLGTVVDLSTGAIYSVTAFDAGTY